MYYFVFTPSPGSAVLLQSHGNVSGINPNLYRCYEKREELVLCRSQFFSLFSLSFVPLLWGSVTLWHLQVTVAFIGCNTYLSLSAEKNLAMIYLELFYCWRWSRFPFPSLPPPFSLHEANTEPASLSLCFVRKGTEGPRSTEHNFLQNNGIIWAFTSNHKEQVSIPQPALEINQNHSAVQSDTQHIR